MNNEIREKLKSMGENKYGEFSSALVPGVRNMLGVRIPKLREFARDLIKNGYDIDLQSDDMFFEETMVKGMMIGYVKVPLSQKLEYIREFVPLIDNWSVCDSFCSTLKFKKAEKSVVWDFLDPYIRSDKEFEQRFAAVLILGNFINEDYIDQVLTALGEINTQAYYSSMGVAWTAAECYIKFPDKTLPCFTAGIFDTPTHNRAIGKICDSYRVEKDKKEYLKSIKK